MSEKDLKLTDLDYATGDHHLQMMKAALPYLDIRRQRSLSMFIRAREMMHTMEFFRENDDDGNGCDVREDVLARDLTDVRYIAGSGSSSDSGSGSGAGCKVKSGVLSDPYTGTTIRFTRGVKTSSAVQIDHVVALENAWQSGANQWDRTKRYRFGNDMYNLLAVDGPANQEKGSASAAYWLPTNGAYRCDYVARQIGVKAKYGLTVTTKEKRAMLSVLRACPAQELPAN